MFIFASFGVQIAGGKLAKCNDKNITIRVNKLYVFLFILLYLENNNILE